MAKQEYVSRNLEWLEAKSREPGVKPLDKGIFYKVLRSGDSKGALPGRGSVVTVHYVGKTINGRAFDSSRGATPPAFRLRELIPGWIIALQHTSRITKNGASTDCFLYPRTDFKSVLFIYPVYLLIFPVFFCKILTHLIKSFFAQKKLLLGNPPGHTNLCFMNMLQNAGTHGLCFLCGKNPLKSGILLHTLPVYETVFFHEFENS